MVAFREGLALLFGLAVGSGGGLYLASVGSAVRCEPCGDKLVETGSRVQKSAHASSSLIACEDAARQHSGHGRFNASELAVMAKLIQPVFENISKGSSPDSKRECGTSDGDVLALLAAAAHQRVDVMIESGTSVGRSAEIMARFFQHQGCGTQVVTVDRADPGQCGASAVETHKRLQGNFMNVRGLRGDSFSIFPRLLKEHAGKRLGLFIDGPKGRDAVKLCLQSLKQSEDIRFCAFHDVRFEGKEESGLEAAKLLSGWGRTVMLACCDAAYLEPLQLKKNQCSLAVVAGREHHPLGSHGDDMHL